MSETRGSSIAELKEMGWGDRAEAFHVWMKQVDKAVEDAIGLSVYDLPDQAFADAFEDEVEPKEFAQGTLEEYGFYIL